ncbi:hypothetical protein PoB_003565100 [Plakobranchus ocellatus]|uniref:Uncharacterized protein n=1 Tax=Plakobranchus ocellatus TaxID=259542 RepID=A0AAV4ADD0_9GAST|nr:hypothetical protein PoB_003565100 [Plakobranchus ocellatus]
MHNNMGDTRSRRGLPPGGIVFLGFRVGKSCRTGRRMQDRRHGDVWSGGIVIPSMTFESTKPAMIESLQVIMQRGQPQQWKRVRASY